MHFDCGSGGVKATLCGSQAGDERITDSRANVSCEQCRRQMKRTPLQGAEHRGFIAAMDGRTMADCPYKDTRKPDGRLTWSRAFRSAWIDGFRRAQKSIE